MSDPAISNIGLRLLDSRFAGDIEQHARMWQEFSDEKRMRIAKSTGEEAIA
jgi:hypothetical protein